MSDPLIPHELVAAGLAIDPKILVRYERLGLIRSATDAGVIGYPASEVRRIWSVVTYHRDLGVNLAGVELLLKMRDQRDELHQALSRLTSELRQALDLGPVDEADADA